MFTVESFDGKPLTKELAAQRIQYEPLIEVTQIKGDGESHPYLSPNDEFAGYEIWDRSNLNGTEAKTPDMLQVRVCPRGAEDRPEAREHARREPLQVRHGRQHRLAHLALDRRGGQLLRQALRRRARAPPLGARRHRGARSEVQRPWLAAGGERPGRRLGDREHPRGDLRRHEAQGNLCHHRHAHDGALLRRLGLHRRRCRDAHARRGRLSEGRADGRRPAQGARRQGADLPRRRA